MSFVIVVLCADIPYSSFNILINCVVERGFSSSVLSSKIFCKYKILGFVSIACPFRTSSMYCNSSWQSYFSHNLIVYFGISFDSLISSNCSYNRVCIPFYNFICSSFYNQRCPFRSPWFNGNNFLSHFLCQLNFNIYPFTIR